MGGDVQIKPYFKVDINVNSIDGRSYIIDMLAYFIQWNKVKDSDIDCHYTCCISYIHNATEQNQEKAKQLMSGIIRTCFASFDVPEDTDSNWSKEAKMHEIEQAGQDILQHYIENQAEKK